MKNDKLKLGGVLFLLGALGVASVLTMEMPLPKEMLEALAKDFSPTQIKLLTLINPTILLIVFLSIGTFLHAKVGLNVPIIQRAINKESASYDLKDIVRTGIVGGLLAGILISLISLIFMPQLPEEFLELGKNMKPSLAARFLYGGITEEILLRFGMMTLLVWIFSKVFGGFSDKVYWIGIFVAAALFALGHFPVAYQAVSEPSNLLLSYIFIGNTIGGIIFGWLYWKKGLEAAFIGHMFAHVAMLAAEPLLVP